MGKQIGALWIKKYTKDGQEKKYLSGVLDLGLDGEAHIAIFPNDRKDTEKQPDYRIVLNGRKSVSDQDTPPAEYTEEEAF